MNQDTNIKIQSNEWEIDNLPNRLTLFRVALIPIIVGLLFATTINTPNSIGRSFYFNYASCIFFIMASITDFFDGFFARKYNIVTVFGSFLDPIADKFLVISSLIMLLALSRIHPLVVLILVLRELYITALRLFALEKGISVPVSTLGKWKTATQMIGIPMLMAFDRPFEIDLPFIGTICIVFASAISLYSALEYSLGLIKKIEKLRKEKRKLKKELKKEIKSESFDQR
jgi:CDP-diacylglycerol--glycerol-3-phosphate 3-phosphatidyltransferase